LFDFCQGPAIPDTVALNKPLGSIAELYNNSLFSDVVISCGKVSVKAHKAVLSTHSDTFLQAFKNQAVGKGVFF
jgi:hypothetical protein